MLGKSQLFLTLRRAPRFCSHRHGDPGAPYRCCARAGPHTSTTLHFIQELRKKHGIDYDSHASYRFVEEK